MTPLLLPVSALHVCLEPLGPFALVLMQQLPLHGELQDQKASAVPVVVPAARHSVSAAVHPLHNTEPEQAQEREQEQEQERQANPQLRVGSRSPTRLVVPHSALLQRGLRPVSVVGQTRKTKATVRKRLVFVLCCTAICTVGASGSSKGWKKARGELTEKEEIDRYFAQPADGTFPVCC